MDTIVQPNWSLVTDYYKEPKDFSELLSLLIPKRFLGSGKGRALLTWKEKEFYRKENLQPFIVYAVNKVAELPKFHKDELPTILRIIRLCQEAEMYMEAYYFMKQQELVQFVHTSLVYTHWDSLTKATAWNYLIVKNRVSRLDETDISIWEKIEFDEECVRHCGDLLSRKEILRFMCTYICKQAKHMSTQQLETTVMGMCVYCNNHITDLYDYELYDVYQRCTEVLSDCKLHPAVRSSQRAIMAQLVNLFHLPFSSVDDYLLEIKEVVEHMDEEFLYMYEEFIGKLLSYIPFFEMVKAPRQAYYVQELLCISKGITYRENMIRNYLTPSIVLEFYSFIKHFLRTQQYEIIHDILFYWCTDEQRAVLERKYNLKVIYDKYASG